MTSLHWQTSLQNRQCHALCTLGRTSKCDRILRPICLWSLHGASFNAGWHCQSLGEVCWDSLVAFLVHTSPVRADLNLNCPVEVHMGGGSTHMSRETSTILTGGVVTAEVSSLTWLTNDAFRFKTPVFGSNAES